VSRRWPGWEDLPGVEVAPIAEFAREKDQPFACFHVIAGQHGAQGAVDRFHLDVAPDGQVTVPGAEDDWEAVVSDGDITGVRTRDGSASLTLVRAPVVIVPSGERAHAPVVYASDPHGLCVPTGDILDAIDSEAQEPNALLSVQVANEDGSRTTVTWGLTGDSAASVIALIRARHGEPLIEAFIDADGVEKITEAAGPHLLMTCPHDRDCGCEGDDHD
jgi:hypothetical protein